MGGAKRKTGRFVESRSQLTNMISFDITRFLQRNASSASPAPAADCGIDISSGRPKSSTRGKTSTAWTLGIAALLMLALPLKAGEMQNSAPAPTLKTVSDSLIGLGVLPDSAFGKFQGGNQWDTTEDALGVLDGDGSPIILPVVPPHLPYLHHCKHSTDGNPVTVPDGDNGTLMSLVCASLSLFAFRHILRRTGSALWSFGSPLTRIAGGNFLRPAPSL
jgi:hypothetical protein